MPRLVPSIPPSKLAEAGRMIPDTVLPKTCQHLFSFPTK